MKNELRFLGHLKFIIAVFILSMGVLGCNEAPKEVSMEKIVEAVDTLEYFNLRPEVEKAYGYSHAVKFGQDIKISGAVSMDEAGLPTAKGDLLQQMKNCYSDLDKVLKHYGCTFDDVVVENVPG